MQTVTNLFIANLALADVVIGMFAIPFQVSEYVNTVYSTSQRTQLSWMYRRIPFHLLYNVSILTIPIDVPRNAEPFLAHLLLRNRYERIDITYAAAFAQMP